MLQELKLLLETVVAEAAADAQHGGRMPAAVAVAVQLVAEAVAAALLVHLVVQTQAAAVAPGSYTPVPVTTTLPAETIGVEHTVKHNTHNTH